MNKKIAFSNTNSDNQDIYIEPIIVVDPLLINCINEFEKYILFKIFSIKKHGNSSWLFDSQCGIVNSIVITKSSVADYLDKNADDFLHPHFQYISENCPIDDDIVRIVIFENLWKNVLKNILLRSPKLGRIRIIRKRMTAVDSFTCGKLRNGEIQGEMEVIDRTSHFPLNYFGSPTSPIDDFGDFKRSSTPPSAWSNI